jgi:hypothetical protein
MHEYLPYMLRADATDDELQEEHELSVYGAFDHDFYLACTCRKRWHFTDIIELNYLNRIREAHRGNYPDHRA